MRVEVGLQLGLAAASVDEHVPRDLRSRGSDPGLVSAVEAQAVRQVPGLLADGYHVLIAKDLLRKERNPHLNVSI
jgi:hypothetical protein